MDVWVNCVLVLFGFVAAGCGHGMVMNWNAMDYAHGGLLGKCILVDEIKLYGETENDKALDESLCQDSFSEMKL
ncbi:hypothetical protein KIW84_030833 [Lathyrus oleraceus]|uniref:Uncharacterized protein n=1 Tax=Pisum sativum TaxID=3888 RepID=A0A9D5B021_PEA|nr:hypothetical protein KIW84_030833 [Pisum sativum]